MRKEARSEIEKRPHLLVDLQKKPGAKRQRLDPLSEEEIIEETTDNLRGEGLVSQQTSPVVDTSTSSYRQELKRQHSVEVSSTNNPMTSNKLLQKLRQKMIL